MAWKWLFYPASGINAIFDAVGLDLIFMLILFGIFLPYQGILIPFVQVLTCVHLYGSTVA